MMTFLSQHEARPLSLAIPSLHANNLFLGEGNPALEVVVLSAKTKPEDALLREAFKKRRNGRATPVLVVVLYADGAALCGTSVDNPPVYHTTDTTQAERLCAHALSLSGRNAAIRFLSDAMPLLETTLPGINNSGLLSLHELDHGTRKHEAWTDAQAHAKAALKTSERALINALGFRHERLDNLTDILRAGNERTAIAVLLKENEVEETSTRRFNNLSPVSYALAQADKEKLPWVIMVQGNRIRLYNTKNIGVGRRGRTESYVECHLALLSAKDAGLLWLLFSADALKDGGTINGILEASKRFAADLAKELRTRIYETATPNLAMGLVAAEQRPTPSKAELALTYEMALTVLFRVLFVAYAEDRDLLPYKSNAEYRARSLKQKAHALADLAAKNTPISKGAHHWEEIVLLFKAVANGNTEWGVPAYNGAMFSSDERISKAGARLAKLQLDNQYFEPALRAILLTTSPELDNAPVDFRLLSVREFGTIYEGLLESELSLAEHDLALDKKATYIPRRAKDDIAVHKGTVYLHNRSGARKASGSYYTPEFAVEHLLDSALTPALDAHLARMEGLKDATCAEQFFNFRVADIAMGSGHFLVAAIDRMERRFTEWLQAHPNAHINKMLNDLRSEANQQLGDLGAHVDIEDSQLLRRMIAKRCIYGVDINPITVQLARLSVWIHTFVPGLPLSLLDHNLQHGNALVGVGSLDEVREAFNKNPGNVFDVDADALLGEAARPLRRLAELTDKTLADIEEGRGLMAEARAEAAEAAALCDIITAQPVAEDAELTGYSFEQWEHLKTDVHCSRAWQTARKMLAPLHALHFPIAFPEVFVGDAPGFDVILGNPPWEEATVNEDKFWARHQPGFAGLSPAEQERLKHTLRVSRPDLVEVLEHETTAAKLTRTFLKTGNFPGMGTGDPDLYKAFAWRFWHLSKPHTGHISVVMPRSVFVQQGSAPFRKALFEKAFCVDICVLLNTNQWIFPIHGQYMIALTTIAKSGAGDGGISIVGPFDSRAAYAEGVKGARQRLSYQEIQQWSRDATLPLLPSAPSAKVFRTLQSQPRLDADDGASWRVLPYREMDATNDKNLMDLTSRECPEGFWKIYKGASFSLWQPDTGIYNAWGDPNKILPWLQRKRLRAPKQSAHKAFPAEYLNDAATLSPNKARIAFRDITNSIDARTVYACLIPPQTFITNKGPVILFPRGDERDEAFLLGVLSSIPLDWCARRYVGLNMNFYIFNALPIPRPARTHPLWQRTVTLTGRLACPDERFAEWAAKVGVAYGPMTAEEKDAHIHELDAIIAHLYGLSARDLTHIFETFHKTWDYKPRLKAVLAHYRTHKATA